MNQAEMNDIQKMQQEVVKLMDWAVARGYPLNELHGVCLLTGCRMPESLIVTMAEASRLSHN